MSTTKTPQQFYNKFNGGGYDIDGTEGMQCVDGFKIFCNWVGLPQFTCPYTHIASDYWVHRNGAKYNGQLSKNFIFISDKKAVQRGDWCIWERGKTSTSSPGHVGMFWEYSNGHTVTFGMRQNEQDRRFRLTALPSNWSGALRWKEWANGDFPDSGDTDLYDSSVTTPSGPRKLYDTESTRADASMREVCYLTKDCKLTEKLTSVKIAVVNYTTALADVYVGSESDGYTLGDGGTYDTSGLNEVARQIVDILTSKGLSMAIAIGIAANIKAETNFNPSLDVWDVNDYSFGLCMWHAGLRTAVKAYCRNHGYAETSVEGQMNFLWEQLIGDCKSVLAALQEVSNDLAGAKKAADIFVRKYERPRGVDKASLKRQRFAEELWNQLKEIKEAPVSDDDKSVDKNGKLLYNEKKKAYFVFDTSTKTQFVIVNKSYSIPKDFGVGGLTADCKRAFSSLVAAAKKDKIKIFNKSGYRSYETQEGTYNNYVAKRGQADADTFSAKPGHSEHQTGLAIDCNSLSDTWGDTKEGKWLAKHCAEFGFIIRYPKGSSSYTGYQYEPWHIRYVGSADLAKKLTKSGKSIEEYYNIISDYSHLQPSP